MRNLTATLCLTISVLFGSVGCDDNNPKTPLKKTEAEKQRAFEAEQKKIKVLEQKYKALMFSNSIAHKASFTFEIQEYFKHKNNVPHFFNGCIYDVEKIEDKFVLIFKVKKKFFPLGQEKNFLSKR